MGGPGSGCWTRWHRKGTTEENRQIDIRYLKRHGFLESGYSGYLSWTRNGTPTGRIGVGIEEDYMILVFNFRQGDQPWKEIEQIIWFDRTPCNYGGERLWFRCPECDRRVAVLHGASELFLCRHCQDLSYASRNEDHGLRMARKAQKVRKQLGLSGDLSEHIWEKPKHMHWKTFERLVSQERSADNAYAVSFAEKLGLLDGC